MVIQETYLKPHHRFRIPNYTVYRQDRPTAAGGVAVLVKSTFKSSALNIPVFNSIEACGVAIPSSSGNLHIWSVYQPAGKRICTLDFDKLFNMSTSIILGGDFNAKHQAYMCTHYHSANNSWDILDFFLTKGVPLIPAPKVITALKSDHLPIICVIPCASLKTAVKHRNKNQFNWNLFQKTLDQLTVTASPPLANGNQIDEAVDALTINITSSLKKADRHLEKPTYYKSLPQNIIIKIKHKNKIWKLFQVTRYSAYKAQYNTLCTEMKTEINEFRSCT